MPEPSTPPDAARSSAVRKHAVRKHAVRWPAVRWPAVLAVTGLAVTGLAVTGPAVSGPAAGATTALDAATAATALVPTIDTVTFGSSASESAHSLTTDWVPVVATDSPTPTASPSTAPSSTGTGLLGQTARRLLPRTPNADYYGGRITLSMAVDPVRQNYVTVKVDGSDTSKSWVLLLVDGKEIGARNDYLMHDEGSLLMSDGDPLLPGRFVYRTLPIPWNLTRGKASVSVSLRSLGEVAAYAAGGYQAKQKRMSAPTVRLYRAYTHVTPQLDTSDETQAAAPVATTAPGRDLTAYGAQWKADVDARAAALLASAPSTATPGVLPFLAQAWTQSWSAVYQDDRVLTWTAAVMDALVTRYSADPTGFSPGGAGCVQWGLPFSDAGEALRLLSSSSAWSSTLSATVDFGGTLGTTTRKAAWGGALRATVDTARYHRATIDSQAILKDGCLWRANAGLRKVNSSLALSTSQASRYVREAVGLRAWSGSDVVSTSATPVAGTPPWGTTFRMVTAAGLGRGPCVTGGDYGEYGPIVYALGTQMADTSVKNKGLAMIRARARMRDHDVDAAGRRIVWVEEPIGCRNTHETAWHPAYLGRGGWEDLLVGAQGATSVGSDVLGWLQQMIADGRLTPALDAGYPYSGQYPDGAPYVPGLLATVLAQPATGQVLPSTDGQPDFVWADPDSAMVAAKHGAQRFWAVFDWRDADAVNRLAKVHLTTTRASFIAEVAVDDAAYTPSGTFVRRSGALVGNSSLQPPDGATNANEGVVLPVAVPPNGVTGRDGGRARGWTLRYGNWLVGLNPDASASYTMATPAGVTSATNVSTGAAVTFPVTVPAGGAVVLWLPDAVPTALAPAAPLSLTAVGGRDRVTLGWDPAPGAVTYQVLRTSGSTTTQVASGLTATGWADSTAVAGSSNSYAVRAVSPDGSVGPATYSVTATPTSGTLPVGWTSGVIGTVTDPGAAGTANGTTTLSATGGDVAKTADGFRFAWTALVGDGSITARVASVNTASTWSRAGVMVRTNLTPGSPTASVFAGVNHSLWAVRTGQDATMTGTELSAALAPRWVRITRSGTTLTGAVSPDGMTWTTVGSGVLPLPTTVYVGLGVVAPTTTAATTATFDTVTVG